MVKELKALSHKSNERIKNGESADEKPFRRENKQRGDDSSPPSDVLPEIIKRL